MNRSASYVHALTGRLRVKIPGIKGNRGRAQEIASQFSLMAGMQQVSANPVTGNLLLIYDPHLLKQAEILAVFQELGYFLDSRGQQVSLLSSASSNQGLVEKITTTLACGLMEVALTRLVSALI